ERQQAERAVLFDDSRFGPWPVGGAQTVEQHERVFVSGVRVEFAGRRNRILPRRRCGKERKSQNGGADGPQKEAHGLLKSALNRAASLRVTVTVWRRSPRSG